MLEARDDYRERAVRAALALADEAEERGDLAQAVDWTRRALAGDRLSEATHRALMRRLSACGERAQALAAYARCRAVLAAEFGAAPSQETRALVAQLRAGGDETRRSRRPRRRLPATRSSSAAPTSRGPRNRRGGARRPGTAACCS